MTTPPAPSHGRQHPPAAGRRAPTEPDLDRLVRRALQSLQNPTSLQRSQLTRLVPPEPGTRDAHAGPRLRQLLMDLIESLRPAHGTRPESPAWRGYRLVHLRYVEELGIAAVCEQMAIRERQYHRVHADAVAALVAQLRSRWEPGPEAPAAPDGAQDVGAPATPSLPATNLPAELTSLIGRERDLDAVGRLMGEHRLVTLCGPGGCGKTRLAIEAAGRALAGFPDGAWFVDFATITDPALVASAVAMGLGVREDADRPLLATLLSALAGRRVLLVLDTCEHVVEGVARLVDAALRACPGLRVLATSREVLGVAGEAVWRVPPLSTPPGDAVSLEGLARYGATRLFVERATTREPTFAPAEVDAAGIVRICRRLDGIPLAIELAAARIAVLRPAQIAERLDARLPLMTSCDRSAPRRHRTLDATLAWSYSLLPERERRLLSRLAVFRDGWTLDAAEGVCAGGPVAACDLAELLGRLVDKSLVDVDRRRGGARYRMLDTVREYAHGRLAEAGEVEASRARHAAWYRGLAERAWGELVGAAKVAWLDALEADLANLRAALAWCRTGLRDREAALWLAGGLTFLWVARGYVVEGRALLAAALTEADGTCSPAAKAMALWGASLLAYYLGDLATSRSLGEEALAIRRAQGRTTEVIQSLKDLGLTLRAQADYPAAAAVLEEAMALSLELGDWENFAAAEDRRGTVAHLMGDMHTAILLYDESYAIWEERGDRSNCAWALLNRGCWLLDRGSLREAREALRESMEIRREDGHVPGLIRLLEAFAELARAEGQPVRAVHLAGAASALRESAGLQRMPGSRAPAGSWLPVARQALGEAPFARAWEAGRALPLDAAIAAAMEEGPRSVPLTAPGDDPRPARPAGRPALAVAAAMA